MGSIKVELRVLRSVRISGVIMTDIEPLLFCK
jgi:hypothetical protein